jgi:hypothetical protein
MIYDQPLTLDETLAVVGGLCAISVILSHLELVSISRFFEEGAWFPAELSLLRNRWTSTPFFESTFRLLSSGKRFSFVLSLSIFGSALVLVAAFERTPSPIGSLIVFVVLISQMLRMPYGLEGSDQMQIVVFGSLTLLNLNPNDETIKAAIVLFISAQACLAYLTAGLAKVVSSQWRSGQAMKGIMATRIYGSIRLHRLFGLWPPGGWIICWLVITFEVTFPVAIVCGPKSALGYLFVGTAFHLAIAVTMGLNCFFWSFISTYPALLWTSQKLNTMDLCLRHPWP